MRQESQGQLARLGEKGHCVSWVPFWKLADWHPQELSLHEAGDKEICGRKGGCREDGGT